LRFFMAEIITPRISSHHIGQFLVACGIAIFIGWQWRIALLRGNPYGGSIVAPNTALCFLLAGIALWASTSSDRRSLGVSKVAAILMGLVSWSITFEHVSHIDLGIDDILFHHRMSDWGVGHPNPGRFAFNTAVAFALAAFGLFWLRSPRRFPVSQISGCIVGSIAYLGIIGHLYGVNAFYSKWMSLATAVLFLVLAAGLMLAHPEEGLTSIVMRSTAGGFLARRLLVFPVLVLPLFGLVEMQLETTRLMRNELATALFVLVSVAVFVIAILMVSVVLSSTDVRRHKAELALRKSEQLAAAGRLSATIAHEINNPLAAAMNLVYLARNAEPENARSLLATAEQELKRVAHISRQTLAFYREDTKPEEFAASELIDEVVSLLKMRVEGKSIKVEKAIEGQPRIVAVKGEIRQVLSNLITNAVDASPTGSIVRLRAHHNGNGTVNMEVQDHGQGIPAAYRDDLFQPFFTTKKDVGTGLGLWVCKNLVDKNGGNIAVQSSITEGSSGTTFTITLKAAGNASSIMPSGKTVI
jgi:signal transduction histidine kinase